MPIGNRNSKFCGVLWCNSCLIKKRALNGKTGDRYDICDHCSHKFFVLQLYQEYSVKAKEKDATLGQLEAGYKQRKEEFMKLRAQHNTRKKEVPFMFLGIDANNWLA